MEIEFRWLIREWEIWLDGHSKIDADRPVLQVRRKEVSKWEESWSDWEDIPTVVESVE